MPARLLETALGLEREHLDLLASQVLHDLGCDHSLQFVAIGDDAVATRHQHLRREGGTLLDGLTIDQKLLPLLDAVLLAADLDHCIHAHRLHTKTPAEGQAG